MEPFSGSYKKPMLPVSTINYQSTNQILPIFVESQELLEDDEVTSKEQEYPEKPTSTGQRATTPSASRPQITKNRLQRPPYRANVKTFSEVEVMQAQSHLPLTVESISCGPQFSVPYWFQSSSSSNINHASFTSYPDSSSTFQLKPDPDDANSNCSTSSGVTFQFPMRGEQQRRRDEEPETETVIKRKNNREAAARCRSRKHERIVKLQENAARLHEENVELKRTVANLRREKDKITMLLRVHIENGCVLRTPSNAYVGFCDPMQ